jgi:hypothetical protein
MSSKGKNVLKAYLKQVKMKKQKETFCEGILIKTVMTVKNWADQPTIRGSAGVKAKNCCPDRYFL